MRIKFTIDDDIQMLRHVIRNQELAPFGNIIWRHFESRHTGQSMITRMRRKVVPNILHYTRHLQPDDLPRVYNCFRDRMDIETRTRFRAHMSAILDVEEDEEEEEEVVEVVRQNPGVAEIIEQPQEEQQFDDMFAGHLEEVLVDPEIVALVRDIVERVAENQKGRERRRSLVPEQPMMQPMASSQSVEVADRSSPKKRRFDYESWHADLYPAVEQAIEIMESEIRTTLGGLPQESPRQWIADEILKNISSQHPKVCRVDNCIGLSTRIDLFVKMRDKVQQRTEEPAVRSAIFLFFEIFEYAIASRIDSETLYSYSMLVNRLTEIAVRLSDS